MRFSFVLPVYGTERYLPRCLESILAQTEGDFEVVVVDDCSPGDCLSALRPYADRVRYIRQDKNRGAFQARVSGMKAAEGDYIVPVDPDDYLMPELLARVRTVVERDDPDVIAYWIENDCCGKITSHWCRHPLALITGEEFLREMTRHAATYSIAGKIVRRAVYVKAMEELAASRDVYVNTSEDFLATLPIVLCSNRVSCLPYAGYRYFTNSTSISYERRTEKGFRIACEQSHLAHELVEAMAVRIGKSEQCRADLHAEVLISERCFCSEVVEGPADQIASLSRILVEVFHPDNVCGVLAEGIGNIKASSAYKLGTLLAQPIRLLRAMTK